MRRIKWWPIIGLLLSSCENSISSGPTLSVSGSGNSPTQSVSNSSQTIEPEDESVSKVKVLDNGKAVLYVDGKPFNLRGAQLRIDGLMNRLESLADAPRPLTYEEMEVYFKKASEIGINTLQLPLEWSKIEISKDEYNFELVDALLSMCNKYNLKCEFLWFSTNMCGDVHQFHVPTYILDDTTTYPRIDATNPIRNHKLYGDFYYLVLDNPNLMERESKVLNKIMDYVYKWNNKNGKKNPLIGVQVHNEPDGLLRWRLNQYNLKYKGKSINPEFLWKMILNALDNAGKTIKSAEYKIYTRVNLTVTHGIDSFKEFPALKMSPLDVMALEGIDIVGDDPYIESPVAINKTMRAYSINNNYPMVCENMGDYASSPAMFLTSYQAGGCYMFYELATSEYFVFANRGGTYHIDQGLLNPDLSYKSHSEDTINIIKGVQKMESIIPIVSSADFAVFNALTPEPKENLSQIINTSNLSFTFTTSNGAIGYAIEHDNYAYLYANKDSEITINNANIRYKADIGAFVGDDFKIEEEKYITNMVAVEANKLYRISIRSINETVTSTTNKNV